MILKYPSVNNRHAIHHRPKGRCFPRSLVTSDAFELLPNKSRKYQAKYTTEVQPVVESQQPVTSDYMNKPVNSMTLQELRQVYGFLGKIFS